MRIFFSMLWIAFRIVFLLMIPNSMILCLKISIVVNCFQNCIFTYDSQHITNVPIHIPCCELLSELYFYLWFPTERNQLIQIPLLWIAFRIVFLLMIPNQNLLLQLQKCVVNCFQNCIFTYDSQLRKTTSWRGNCCELLSELYFYLWFPTCIRFVCKAS